MTEPIRSAYDIPSCAYTEARTRGGITPRVYVYCPSCSKRASRTPRPCGTYRGRTCWGLCLRCLDNSLVFHLEQRSRRGPP